MKFQLLVLLFLIPILGYTQKSPDDTAQNNEVKTGFSMGGVPAIAYDADLGYRYGIILNFYLYGDGSNYPDYNHSLYTEWSKTTQGNQKYQLVYDSEYLIPNSRLTIEASYITEKKLNFFGFNGYNSYFNKDFIDENSEDYISRVYYAQNRKMLRLKADYMRDIGSPEWRWLLGFVHYNIETGTVNIDNLNQGKSSDNLLPDTALLYDRYVEWGIIPEDQARGGNMNLLKTGIIYDTRDVETNPFSGIWSEALILSAPDFLGNDYAYTKLLLTHRQYLTVIPERINFAYRLSYQTKISGEIPYYMLPFYFDSKKTRDGLGGSNTLRGIKRNRIVGDGFVALNTEFRWKFFKTTLFNQNIYFALGTFLDGGRITNPWEFETDGVPNREDNKKQLDYRNEAFHLSYGTGLYAALNNNFVVAIDYGRAFDEQDGSDGLYVGIDFMF